MGMRRSQNGEFFQQYRLVVDTCMNSVYFVAKEFSNNNNNNKNNNNNNNNNNESLFHHKIKLHILCHNNYIKLFKNIISLQ